MQSDKNIEIESLEEGHTVLTGEEKRKRPREKGIESTGEAPGWQWGNKVAEETIRGSRQHFGGKKWWDKGHLREGKGYQGTTNHYKVQKVPQVTKI